MILSENEELIPDAVSVINAESFALLGIENLNTGDGRSSDEDDNDDEDGVYEPPVDENRNFLNVFDSFVDEGYNISIKTGWFSISKSRFKFYFSLHSKPMFCFLKIIIFHD